MNTPAVTRVEEWTKAETGVGAAIAAGNQDLKGNWADLVIDSKIKITPLVGQTLPAYPLPRPKAKTSKKKQSPIRLSITVNIPEPSLLRFL